jgi:hypothetical protein
MVMTNQKYNLSRIVQTILMYRRSLQFIKLIQTRLRIIKELDFQHLIN